MDLLKPACALAALLLFACSDPFAPDAPEPPSKPSGQFSTSAQMLPTQFGKIFASNDSTLLGNLLGDSVALSNLVDADLDHFGITKCFQRLSAFRAGSTLYWWNSSPTTISEATSDTAELSFEYRLERIHSATDSGKIDTLAQQKGSRWKVLRVNPSEWRLIRWEDPSKEGSFRKLCETNR